MSYIQLFAQSLARLVADEPISRRSLNLCAGLHQRQENHANNKDNKTRHRRSGRTNVIARNRDWQASAGHVSPRISEPDFGSIDRAVVQLQTGDLQDRGDRHRDWRWTILPRRNGHYTLIGQFRGSKEEAVLHCRAEIDGVITLGIVGAHGRMSTMPSELAEADLALAQTVQKEPPLCIPSCVPDTLPCSFVMSSVTPICSLPP